MRNLFLIACFILYTINNSCNTSLKKDSGSSDDFQIDTILYQCFELIPKNERTFLYAAYFVNTLYKTYIIFDQILHDDYIRNKGLPKNIIYKDSLTLLLYNGYEEVLPKSDSTKISKDYQTVKSKYKLMPLSNTATLRNSIYVFLLKNGIVSKFEGNQESLITCFYDLILDTTEFIPPKLEQ